MKTTFALALATASLLSVSAHADRACLQRAHIWNWTAPNNRTLIVEDDWHKKFKVSLMRPCQDLTFHTRLGLKTPGEFGLSCMSAGDSVISGSPIGPQSCPISKIEMYTPDMEKADKEAAAAAKAASH